MLMHAVMVDKSACGEWEIALGVDHREHPSIICLNRPGGLGSQKPLSLSSPPRCAIGFVQNYTFLYNRFFFFFFLSKSTVDIHIAHRLIQCWGPVTVAGKPHCALNNSPLNLFFLLFLSLKDQSLAKVMGHWVGDWFVDLTYLNIFV